MKLISNSNSMSDEELQLLVAKKKVLSYIGLGTKAGNIASGEFATEKAVKNGTGYLVIVAGDASDNTKKMFNNMCSFYQVPLYLFGDKQMLGHSMGKEYRASLAFLDKGLAQAVRKQLEIAKNGGSNNGKN